MSAPLFYRSTDASAPTMGNTNGSLTSLLDAVLVTGYTTQSITGLTYAAGVISATKVAHGYIVGDIISISGAVEDEYNGRVTVLTRPDADHFTYAPYSTSPASSPATGTLLGNTAGVKAGAGWQLVATGTNVRCYRARAGSRMYLGIDDNGNVYEAKVRGFETQTAAGVSTATGTGPFPTAAQLANGVFWQKTINTAGNRPWFIAVDDRTLIYHAAVDNSVVTVPVWNGGYFGDIYSHKPADAYNCLLIGKAATIASSTSDVMLSNVQNGSISPAATAGHYMPRAATQTGTSITVSKFIETTKSNSGASGNVSAGITGLHYPDWCQGCGIISRYYIVEATNGPRGWLRGMWALPHLQATLWGSSGLWPDDSMLFEGFGPLAGLTFEERPIAISANPAFGYMLETTSTGWTGA